MVELKSQLPKEPCAVPLFGSNPRYNVDYLVDDKSMARVKNEAKLIEARFLTGSTKRKKTTPWAIGRPPVVDVKKFKRSTKGKMHVAILKYFRPAMFLRAPRLKSERAHIYLWRLRREFIFFTLSAVNDVPASGIFMKDLGEALKFNDTLDLIKTNPIRVDEFDQTVQSVIDAYQ